MRFMNVEESPSEIHEPFSCGAIHTWKPFARSSSAVPSSPKKSKTSPGTICLPSRQTR